MTEKEMVVKQQIAVDTPIGVITAEVVGTPDEYPGIRISVNGTSYVFVEYDTVKEAAQVVTYDDTSDDPKDIIVLSE